MEKAKRSYIEVKNFIAYANDYINRNPNERSKFTFALNKLKDKLRKSVDDTEFEISEAREILEAEYCLKDKDTGAFKDKQIVLGPQQVVYKKEFNFDGEKKMRERRKDLLLSYENDEKYFIEFVPFYVEIPPMLDISWLKWFYGFVFRPMDEIEEAEWYEEQGEMIKKRIEEEMKKQLTLSNGNK